MGGHSVGRGDVAAPETWQALGCHETKPGRIVRFPVFQVPAPPRAANAGDLGGVLKLVLCIQLHPFAC